MVIICNSNDEIISNTDWEFQPKDGGLDCFKIYTHCTKSKKKLYNFLKV